MGPTAVVYQRLGPACGRAKYSKINSPFVSFVVGNGEKTVVADYYVVYQTYVKRLCGIVELLGLTYVRSAWPGVAAGMVVYEDDSAGVALKCKPYDAFGIYYGHVVAAAADSVFADEEVAPVEQQYPAFLVAQALEFGYYPVVGHAWACE